MSNTPYTHTISGRFFTVTSESSVYGACAADSIWDSGQTGAIWVAA